MGCYSFLCKGCGSELCEPELVRLGGIVQTYDSYGGSMGGENIGPCWHEVCYQEATDAQKLDDEPSGHASNQGMDPAKLEFLDDSFFAAFKVTKVIITTQTTPSFLTKGRKPLTQNYTKTLGPRLEPRQRGMLKSLIRWN